MGESDQLESQAQVVMPATDLNKELEFFEKLGFRLDHIYPDDSPVVAMMSGHGLRIRLDQNAKAHPAEINILTDDAEVLNNGKAIVSPSGTLVTFEPKSYTVQSHETQHKFEVRKLQDSDPWVIGRAGMQYRDLIPGRLGGGIIASHIRIPEGGPVPDVVHYHIIGFQLIYCYKGWVKLVYEDQGPAFILEAGDCVTQPPEIRHRVLEASDNLEVIEIGVPAEHVTTIDHDMELPTTEFNPDRNFKGQKFCHHIGNVAKWSPWRIEGFEFRETGIEEATGGVASVQVARLVKEAEIDIELQHDADILFTFVMNGSMELSAAEYDASTLTTGDAFTVPPDLTY
ncbi:MAG: cupin domain-containing protein, partial [Flavobacteriales bacterium]|nr:cupin domain-containing protein [Flavobacteriales bacterium]